MAGPPEDTPRAAPFFRYFAPENQRDPYPMYERARREEPVLFSDELGMWVVTRHEDVCAVLRDPRRFSSRMSTESAKPPPPEVLEVLQRGFPRVPGLLNNDPPSHTRLRRLCNRAFTRQNIATMEGSVREFTDQLIDVFVDEGRADLVGGFTSPLPKLVIADIVGVPRADIRQFGRWADEVAVFLFSEELPTERWVRAAEGVVALQHYVADLAEERAQTPREDLISALVHAGADDQTPRLDKLEILTLVNMLLVAGQKTTTDLLGNALVLLLDHPEVLAALREDPDLAPRVVEETIRRDAPVPGMHRVATEDVEIGGVHIPEGGRVFLSFASANHDEALFEEPMRFDIHRENASSHVGFGFGVHFCLGAPLARMEGRIALETLVRRLPGLRHATGHEVAFRQITAFRGPVALDLCWDVPPDSGT